MVVDQGMQLCGAVGAVSAALGCAVTCCAHAVIRLCFALAPSVPASKRAPPMGQHCRQAACLLCRMRALHAGLQPFKPSLPPSLPTAHRLHPCQMRGVMSIPTEELTYIMRMSGKPCCHLPCLSSTPRIAGCAVHAAPSAARPTGTAAVGWHCNAAVADPCAPSHHVLCPPATPTCREPGAGGAGPHHPGPPDPAVG